MHDVQPVENRLAACEEINLLEGAQAFVVDEINGYLSCRESIFDGQFVDATLWRYRRGNRDVEVSNRMFSGPLVSNSQGGDLLRCD